MPVYDYYCKKCKETFEALVDREDLDKEVKCPTCKTKLERKFSAPRGIIIK